MSSNNWNAKKKNEEAQTASSRMSFDAWTRLNNPEYAQSTPATSFEAWTQRTVPSYTPPSDTKQSTFTPKTEAPKVEAPKADLSASGTVSLSDLAREIRDLEAKRTKLKDDYTRQQIAITESPGTDTGMLSELNRIEAELAPVEARLKELKTLRPEYKVEDADAKHKNYAEAEARVAEKHGSVDSLVAQMNMRAKLLTSLDEQLESLTEQYKANPTPELYAQYDSVYSTYEEALGSYKELESELAPVSAAWQDYNDYETAALGNGDIGEAIKKSAYVGWLQIGQALTATLAVPERILSSVLPGMSTPISDWADQDTANVERARRELEETIHGRGEAWQAGAELTSTTISMLPHLLASVLSYGMSAPVASSALATTAYASQAANSATYALRMAPSLMQARMKDPSYLASLAMTFGTEFDEAQKSGANIVESTAAALIASLINAEIEIGGGLEDKEAPGKLVNRILKSGHEEGWEEVLQGAVSGAVQKTIAGADKPWFSMEDPNAVIHPGTMAKEYALGAAAGGLMTGVQSAGIAAANRVLGVDKPQGQTYTGTVEALSPAATPVAQQLEQQATATRAANPSATVLDAGTTMYVNIAAQQGKKTLKKSQEKAAVVQKLIEGKDVTPTELNTLNLTDKSYREVFTQLTGVQFPEGTLRTEQLYSLARSAHKVAQDAQMVQQVEAQQAQVRQQTSEIEAKQTQVQAQADPEFQQFAAAYREVVNPEATDADAEVQSKYQDYTRDTETVTVKGQPMNRQQFGEFLRSAPGGAQLTNEEVDALFTSQKNKEATNARQGENLVHSPGLQGQPDQSTGGYGGGLSEGAGAVQGQSPGSQGDLRSGREDPREALGRTGNYAPGGEPVLNTDSTVSGTVVAADGRTVYKPAEAPADAEWVRETQKAFARAGVDYDLAEGDIPIPGTNRSCDGVSILGVTSIFRVDSPFHNKTQLRDHEVLHQYFFRDGKLKKSCFDLYESTVGRKLQHRLFDAYLGKYKDVYTRADSKTQKQIEQDIIEEIICDAYAGMNRDGAGADQLQSLIKPLVDAWCAEQDAMLADAETRYSIDSMAESVGLTFEKDGQMTVFKDAKGNVVDNITEDRIRKSPLGAVIESAVKADLITSDDADKQVTFFSELFNLMTEVQDIDLLWAVSATLGFQPIESGVREQQNTVSKFAGYTKNSDPQYSTTVDFTTICVKTQAVIDAMSETMKKLGHGLTEQEIVDIVYRNTHDAGEPVPCPVCYVFSRWVGLGGLFDRMNQLQIQYANADPETLRADIAALEEKIDGIMAERGYALTESKGKKSYVIPGAESKKSFGDARTIMYKEMVQRQTALQSKQNADLVSGEKTMTAAETKELAKLKDEISILDNWTWLNDVRLAENYEPVPPEVLFDINAGKTFAEQYPESWKFRTTRGPAMGKAATPYADEHLGQILRGVGVSDLGAAELGNPAKNPFLKGKDGKLTKAAEKALRQSRAKAKVQNLLNGQRYQSTSDFRFEYALDYLLSFVEMQALGSKVQLYTKVAEAVRMFASVLAEVNCSLMPEGDGYRVNKDGTKTLTFSSITGMNAEDAFQLSSEFDNVQPIMVGVNNEHIRLCMADDRITFIIPYHASGAGEARYVALMQIVGENVESRTDYSAYQTDHKNENATKEQKAAYDLRVKLLTGKLGMLNDADKQILRGNDVLHNLYKRFYGQDVDGNRSDIDPKYLSPGVRESGKLFHDPECAGVFLTSEQAKTVMPFEYWDRTSTIETADTNGQAFVEYCESLGLKPRFSGWDGKGAYHTDMDFSKVPGYWKMLIDRRCYNRDGSYHEQQAIDVTNFDAGYLFREEAIKGIKQPSQVNDPNKTAAIAEKSAAQVREGRGETKFSIVTDPEVIERLENDDYLTVYKAMQVIDGELYPPMAAEVKDENGKRHLKQPSKLGQWQQAEENPSAIKSFKKPDKKHPEGYGVFELLKGTGKSKDDITAAYNPYEHTSNIVLNDQFETAYKRPNLVTVEFRIPKSEAEGLWDADMQPTGAPYMAKHAKDSVGLLTDWKPGPVAKELKNSHRDIYLTRWSKPVRILDDAEVAQKYKEILDNEPGVSVPFNVVTPSLLAELEKAGVAINYDGSAQYQYLQQKAAEKAGTKYSIYEDNDGNALTEDQQEFFSKSKAVDWLGRLIKMYHGSRSFGFTEFDPSFSDDGRSLFFTDDPDTARTYTGTRKEGNDIHALSKDTDMTRYEHSGEFDTEADAWDYLESAGYKKLLPDPITPEQVKENIKSSIGLALDEANEWLTALEMDLPKLFAERHLQRMRDYSLGHLKQALMDLESTYAEDGEGAFYDDLLYTGMSTLYGAEQQVLDDIEYFFNNYPRVEFYDVYEGLRDAISDPESQGAQFERLRDAGYAGGPAYVVYSPSDGVFHLAQSDLIAEAKRVYRDSGKGLYEVYLNLENPLEIDANGYNWNELNPEDLHEDGLNEGVYWEGETTREIAEWAEEHGYDGVILKNLWDRGRYATGDENEATIMIAFKPEQVKSTANLHPTKNPDVRYSIVSPDLSFADQVDLVAVNKLNEVLEPGTTDTNPNGLTFSAVYVAKEPNQLMQDLGYGDLPLVVTQHHIRQMLGQREDVDGNILDAHNHQLTRMQVKRLPDMLQHPAAVIRAKNRPESLIFITTMKDYAGRPIIIPVKANGINLVYDGKVGPAHVVTSMYGRENFGKFFEDAVKAGSVVYYDEKRIDPILTAAGYQSSGLLSGIDSNTIVGQVEPKVKDVGERKYSITPEFEKWYKENFDADATDAQLKRRLQTQERRIQQAEESAKAAEFKRVMDTENQMTAWLIHHTKTLRAQKQDAQAKLAAARKERAAAIRAAVAETKELERAKAELQHEGDMIAMKRQAAKRLRTQENAYQTKVEGLKENLKLKRNAAKATLRNAKLAEKKRAAIETEQGLVDTIRKNPKERSAVEKRQATAQALRTLGRSAYRNFVNQAEAIDRFAKRQISDLRAGTLVTTLGGAASTVDSIFKNGLVNRAGDRIGGSMKEVFLCWDDAGKNVDENKQALLQDFMLHWHNVDRMSIESRAASALETFENKNEWLRDMEPKELARLVAMTEKEVAKLGKQQAQQAAFKYLQMLYRFNSAQNKPVFADANGNPVTAETSQQIVKKYLDENPWLLDKANGIYEWWDQFMRAWAVGDTISETEYAIMRDMYPHYAPTYRADKSGVGGANFVGMGGASVSKAVKRARGGTSEVLNIEDSFSNLVSKIVRLQRVNALYMNIIDTAMLDEDGTFADMAAFDWDWQTGEYGKALELNALLNGDLETGVDDAEKAGLEKVGENDYKLTGWRDGRKYTADISKDLYKSIGNVTGHLDGEKEKILVQLGNTLTGPMKTAITGINPNFALRNVFRDLPTAVINSISGMAFPKYWAQAAKEMMQNSENWQRFQALGGTHATYYNDNQGFVKMMSGKQNVFAKGVEKMGSFNEATEAQTRFAEYLATIDRLGDTYESRLQGIKNAAEVTVDFSRKGSFGKLINAWVPYWNPAVQGIDKVVRSVIDSPDGSAVWKQAVKTLGRAAMTSVLFEAVLYGFLKALDRDDEWEELNDRTKDTYYCIPLKDSHTFLKIPKNREWGAILGTPFMRLLEYANGRDNPFENYIETAIEPNFLPPAIFRPDAGGGFTSDIVGISQAMDIDKNKDFAGHTIVPYAYQQGTLSQQFDNETSWFAKQLGELFNWSPMHIDYIIEDYFGDFGELFTMATAEATWSGDKTEVDLAQSVLDMLMNPWFADNRYSNADVNKYYELMNDLGRVVQDKKNQLGNEAYKETVEYQTQKAVEKLYGDQISELNKKVRELPEGPDKDAAKEQIAQATAAAIQYYEACMSGEVKAPVLDAEYADLSSTVSNELIRMAKYSSEYKFTPTGTPSAKYEDPNDKTREYVLTSDQKDKFKAMYRDQYDETYANLIRSTKYRKATDTAKAAMLEDARDDVLKDTKDEFLAWLKRSGARSVPKK